MAERPIMQNFSTSTSTSTSVIVTETPFDKRHCCWFCGEPQNSDFIFPPHNTLSGYHEDDYLLLNCPHPVISVPSCGECATFARKAREKTIWDVKHFVKRQLIKLHAKDLAIGINWTEQELASSEFEEGNFAGFARSAWFIYELAKGRLNFSGWVLVANGLELDENIVEIESSKVFHFDGLAYPTLDDAITHYAKVFLLEPHYVTAVLQHLSYGDLSAKAFAQAVRFCRLLVNATPNERKAAFKKLIAEG